MKRERRAGLAPAAALVALSLLAQGAAGGDAPPATAPAGVPADAYVAEIAAWRAARETRLRSEDGWLTLAGLHWLEDGTHAVGSAEGSAVRLPAGAPPRVGTLELRQGQVGYRLEPGVAGVTLDGDPAPPAGTLRSDDEGAPGRLAVGSVSFYVIKRGARRGVRVKDSASATRRDFAGLDWYPIDPAFRVRARLVPHAGPRAVRVPNVVGYVEEMVSPGELVFTLHGRERRLTPVFESAGAKELFVIFKDATAGQGTYPAGRFVYAPLPEDGFVTLDFNKAYTPPCAFTPYATCPLPPPENRLEAPIEAGEKYTAKH